MTKGAEARAIITGSFILFLVNALVEGNRTQTFKEVKKLRKRLLEQTCKAQYLPYVKMSNIAWQQTVDTYKDKNYRVIIFDAVEHLSIGEEDVLEEMFGEGTVEIACLFSLRFSDEEISNDGLGESREVCKALKENLKKIVFNEVR